MKCYRAFVRQQLNSLTLYRFEFVMKVLYGCIAMYGVRCLWYALHAQNPALLGRSLPDMITYAMMAMAMDLVFYPSGDNAVYDCMNAQVKSGSIDTDLLRPMGFQRQMLYRNASRMMVLSWVLVLPAWLLAVLFMGMQLPSSLVHLAAFFVSVGLAYFVLFSLSFLLGLLGMITMDIRHISWAYRGLVDLLSGKLVPLWLFPPMLMQCTNLLSFRCIYDIPLNIYTGAFDAAEIFKQLGFQCMWALVLMSAGHLLWRKVHLRLTVQGG